MPEYLKDVSGRHRGAHALGIGHFGRGRQRTFRCGVYVAGRTHHARLARVRLLVRRVEFMELRDSDGAVGEVNDDLEFPAHRLDESP